MTATRELFLQDQGYPLTVLTSPVVNKLDLSKILTPLSHSAKRRAVSDIGLWWKRCVQSCACASLLSFNESYYLLDVIFDQWGPPNQLITMWQGSMSTHNNQCLEKEGGEALLWIPFGHVLNTVSPLKMDLNSGASTVHITLGAEGGGGWVGAPGQYESKTQQSVGERGAPTEWNMIFDLGGQVTPLLIA